jgi:CRISPR system Cascade subunit CasE
MELDQPRYLSKLSLSDRVGPYAAHRKVYAECREDPRPLWRRCPGYALVLSAQPVKDVPSRLYDPHPRSGEVVGFDLLAEITISRKADVTDRARGRRVDPVLEGRFAAPQRPYAELAREHGTKWLTRKAQWHGFEIMRLDGCDYDVLEFVRDKKPIRIGTIRFSGRLRIADADKFREAMLTGIGHGKAWGCGLLICTRN